MAARCGASLLVAAVHKDNTSSCIVLERCGFTRTDDGVPGESMQRWVKNLSPDFDSEVIKHL